MSSPPPPVAWAADVDADGYATAPAFPVDCDDYNAAVNPNADELVGNGSDDDCDGTDALGRRLLFTNFPTPAWTATGYVLGNVDGIRIGNGIAAGSITRTFTIPVNRGSIRAAVDLNNYSGAGPCSVSVSTTTLGGGSPTTATSSLTATGTTVSAPLAVNAAPRRVTGITLACPAGTSMLVDWLTIQNSEDVFPPVSELSIVWDDTEAPGGGLSTTVVRMPEDDKGSETTYAGSDVGGVARWGPDDPTWVTINGEGATGLTSQADLGVWDVLPVGTELYALSGHTFSGSASWNKLSLAGGFWRSADDGGTWERLGESHDAVGTGYGVGGYGRYSGCTDTEGSGEVPEKTYAGGKLLTAEPDVSGLVYLANGDEDELGVALWDGTDLCALPVSGTLPTYADVDAATFDHAYVRALARTTSDTTGLPVLLVGYLGLGGSVESLYLCQLPAAYDEELDVYAVSSTFSCSGSETATCTAVTDSMGLDIRDLEVDPLVSSRVYLADGGNLTGTASTCDAGAGGIYTVDVTDDGTTASTVVAEVPQAFDDLVGNYAELTGLSVDPSGDFLFAFIPVSHGAVYRRDRMYRVPMALVDAGSVVPGDWEPINVGSDDGGDDVVDAAERLAAMNVDPDKSWLYADTVAKPDPYPERWAPGQVIDGVWIDDPSSYLDVAVLASTFNIWRVERLDSLISSWDADADPEWLFAPVANTTVKKTFQETVVNHVAEDTEGNIWMPMWDLGMLMLPYGGVAAERDCLWDAVNGGGSEVSTTPDGSVWFTIWQQSDGIPQDIGVFRTLDNGGTWEFEAAGVSNSNYRDGTDYRCIDEDNSHTAAVMATGYTFNDGVSTPTTASWGNPLHLAALHNNAAVVQFQSYDYVDTTTSATVYVPGRLAITLNGGADWGSVPFDGDWNGVSDTTDCDEYQFFELPKGVELLSPGSRSYSKDTDSDGVIESGEWAIELLAAARYSDDDASSGDDPDERQCALAKVALSGDPASPTAVWTWFSLDATTDDCLVDYSNILGVAVSPWSDEAWVYGYMTHYRTTIDFYRGGACILDVDTPGSATLFVDPGAGHMYSVADVVPHPYVPDTVLVVPQLDSAAWFECTEQSVATGFSLDCPDVPAPFLMTRPVGTWEVTTFANLPPSMVGNAGAWTTLDRSQLLYATAGSGVWRGTLTW